MSVNIRQRINLMFLSKEKNQPKNMEEGTYPLSLSTVSLHEQNSNVRIDGLLSEVSKYYKIRFQGLELRARTPNGPIILIQ